MIKVAGAVPLVAAVCSLLLAFLVYTRAPDRRVGRAFAILATALVFWNLNFFGLYAFASYETAFRISWICRTGAVFILPAILHLSLVLSGPPLSPRWKLSLAADYLWMLGLALLNLRGDLVHHLESFTWGYYSVGTGYYHLFTLALVVNCILAFVILVRFYHTTADARTRTQLRFWLVGMAVALPLGLTNLLPAYGVYFYPLGNLGSVVWAGIVAYAIVRHRLMDIEVVVARGLSHTIAVILVVAPGVGILVALQDFAFGEVHYDYSAAVALVLFATGVIYSTLREAVEKGLERLLFPRKLEGRVAMVALAGEVVRVLDRGALIEMAATRLAHIFSLGRVAIYLREEVRGSFDQVFCIGSPATPGSFEHSSVLVRCLATRREAMLREEVVAAAGGREGSALPTDWVVCVPLVNGPDLLGMILLGPRREMQDYSTGDLSLLNDVAAGAAIALQNARLYDELKRSREIINRAGRLSALGTLAAGIAHEVRNPLVSIQTFFQLAPGRLEDEEFMTSFLRLAEAEVQRISDLISELLTFAKSPSLTLEEVDLGEIAERTVTLLEPQARAGGIRLECRACAERSFVLADGDRMMQVVLNLALNAIQATPQGGRVELATRMVVSEGDVFCQLEVSDTGPGIAVSLRDTIWDPFFTTKEKGSGLGLSIAHQIVVEAGGTISLESVEGNGTRFFVNLPVIKGRAAHSQARQHRLS